MTASAVALLVLPGAAQTLVYERVAVADGELWRLLTAHLVHYSSAHLFNNMLVLVAAAWWVEIRYRSQLLYVVALSAAAIGIGVFVFEEDIGRYAGASGVSLALLTYAALRGLGENRRWRIVCAMILMTIVLKLVAESLLGWHAVDWQQQAGFVTVTLSHVIGAGVGGLFALPHVFRKVRATRCGVNLHVNHYYGG